MSYCILLRSILIWTRNSSWRYNSWIFSRIWSFDWDIFRSYFRTISERAIHRSIFESVVSFWISSIISWNPGATWEDPFKGENWKRYLFFKKIRQPNRNKNRLRWFKKWRVIRNCAGHFGKSLRQTRSWIRISVPGSLVCSDQISTAINCRKEP